MGFGTAIRTCFRKALTFSGRAKRPEFWFFALFVLLGLLGAGQIDYTLFGPGPDAPFISVFALAVLLPLVAAAWRRMHDTGRSGLFVCYPLIVLLGLSSFIGVMGEDVLTISDLSASVLAVGGVVAWIGLFVLMISPLLVIWWLSRPSQPRDNQWGPAG